MTDLGAQSGHTGWIRHKSASDQWLPPITLPVHTKAEIISALVLKCFE